MNQPVASGSVKFTAETAPRDADELALIGRFRLKDLAMSIGLGDSPEHRSALTSMKVEDLAKSVAQQLARLDAAVPAPAAATVEEPAQAPAPEPAQEAPKRNPRGPRVAPPQEVQSHPVMDLTPVMEMLGTLQSQVSNLAKQLGQHETIMAAAIGDLQFRAGLNTSLSLFFAEEELGGARPDILAAALTDMPGISQMVADAATPGKASKGGK